MVHILTYLEQAVNENAADLFLIAGKEISIKGTGGMRPLTEGRLSTEESERLVREIYELAGRELPERLSRWDDDFALSVANLARFRINVFQQRGSLAAVIRVVHFGIPDWQKMGLTQEIMKISERTRGLVLVTGPAGSGKSTTLACVVDAINRNRYAHIITIEDPIEYVHKNKKSLIQQRELNADTMSFARALKSALRQDPDVILVGEMRDPETISAALTAAETGHLVMATLHTNSASQTIDRIIDTFPPEQQNQIRLQLSSCVIGIISQRLLMRADTDGRVAAFEILIGTPPVQALIRDGKSSQLTSVMETGFKDGMITMRRSLEELLAQGLIYEEDAKALSLDAVEVQSFE